MIRLNEKIIDILSGSTELNELINDNIYSIVVPENISNPVVIITRKFANNEGSKDGYSKLDCTLNIDIYTDEYEESLIIAELINNTLNGYRDNNIKSLSISSCEESFNDQFNQNLIFDVVTYS